MQQKASTTMCNYNINISYKDISLIHYIQQAVCSSTTDFSKAVKHFVDNQK